MSKRSLTLIALIRLSQHIGRGNFKQSFNVLKETFVEQGPRKFTESDHEAKGLDEFLVRFPSSLLTDLRDKCILDFGCGYGGKAVELSQRLPTATIIGIEPHVKKIEKAIDFAMRRRSTNCRFELCSQQSIPLPDSSVDAIVCHDVLEHVHHPADTIREMHRVLRPGGRAYIVFPPYDGPVSHHLDFITQMPGLHWFFSADTIMETVNGMLSSEYGKRFKTPPQPLPTFSAVAGKRVLPSLNGLGTETFTALTNGLFSIKHIERITLIDRLTKLKIPQALTSRMKRFALQRFPSASDHLTLTMAVVIEKT
jgi:SAM-dependent methyltransferase